MSYNAIMQHPHFLYINFAPMILRDLTRKNKKYIIIIEAAVKKIGGKEINIFLFK